jgi:hypothetical protein
MSGAETDKMMDVLSEITLKILRENERRKQKSIDTDKNLNNVSQEIKNNNLDNENTASNDNTRVISKEKEENINTEEKELQEHQINDSLEEHSKELNDFIENEVTNEEENKTYLTKDELEGMLNEHFSRIHDVLHDYEGQNIDADTFKGHLNGLVGHVKNNTRKKFKSISHTSTKPIRELKSYARSRINQFMDGINERLKRMSSSIEKNLKEDKNVSKETINDKQSYKQKIENTLRNDPQLLKEVATITRLNAISKHLDSTRDKIKELDNLEVKTPEDQAKISGMKDKLNNHAKEIQNEVNELSKSHSQEQTLDKINTKVMEIERSDKEVTLER